MVRAPLTARYWKDFTIGWAGANTVFWNCKGDFLVQKPPTAQNYSFGHVGVNAVIQRKGIRLALFVTRHFRDVLELARLKSPDPYHLLSERPKPLVTRGRVFEIDGRLAADGSELEPLDEASVEAALRQAEAAGAEGIVLALLHAYRNPAHEHAAKAVIARLRPNLPVYCSADVWPIIREYERTVTATVHGHAQPRVAEYLGSLQSALKRAGVAAEPMVTKSNGGVMRAELGKTRCVEMLLSGTAAGAWLWALWATKLAWYDLSSAG